MQSDIPKVPEDLEEMRVQFYHYATQQHYILDKVNQLEPDVKDIKRTLFQIKWFLLGGVVILLTQQIGVWPVLAAILK
mgnify:FL=1|jgi:hypothetical protein|tara:strand:+ start:383 stop:616 length:234 start_codon:yes stop_codon:yes gene_type:complete